MTRRPGTRALLIALLLTASAACGGDPSSPGIDPEDVRAAAATITAQRIGASIDALAHDSARGRDTPTPELDRAAAWLARRLEEAGLGPGGTEGYLQPFEYVPMDGTPGRPANVLAVLEGSDPDLRESYVVVTAHYDHIGVREPDADGDSIYNGADDNASGTAALLEVARAMAMLEERPARSILFLATAAEEKGLLGAIHFVTRPTVPAAGLVANINLDMVSRNAPDSVWAVGKDFTTMGSMLDEVSADHPGLDLVAIHDGGSYLRGSDHAVFASVGVPAIFFFTGLHPDYHRPGDEPSESDDDKAARVARLAFYLAHRVATASEPATFTPAGLEALGPGIVAAAGAPPRNTAGPRP